MYYTMSFQSSLIMLAARHFSNGVLLISGENYQRKGQQDIQGSHHEFSLLEIQEIF